MSETTVNRAPPTIDGLRGAIRAPHAEWVRISPPPTPAQEALDHAETALGKAVLDGQLATAGGVFTGLGYLGYKIATEGPLHFLIPDNPQLIITALFAALTLGFIGKGVKDLANAARWAAVAGARRVFSGTPTKGAPLEEQRGS